MPRARIVLLVTSLAATLALTGCTPLPWTPEARQNSEWISALTFSQSQAVPGFDTSEYFLEGADVDGFIDLLTAHGIHAGTYVGPDTSGCTGGLSADVTMEFHGAGPRTVTIDACGLADASFEVEANAFLTAWREAHPNGGFANDQIRAVTYSLSQAIEGFDDTEYRQEDRDQVGRFAALLDRYGITASEYDPPTEPCEGGLSADVTLEYAATDLVAALVVDGCTVDDGFSADALELLEAWRHDQAD
jgi:hypothetical protein